MSTVVNRALRHELRLERGLAAVREWETEHGELAEAELLEADRILDSAPIGDHPVRAQRRR